LFEFCMSIMS